MRLKQNGGLAPVRQVIQPPQPVRQVVGAPLRTPMPAPVAASMGVVVQVGDQSGNPLGGPVILNTPAPAPARQAPAPARQAPAPARQAPAQIFASLLDGYYNIGSGDKNKGLDLHITLNYVDSLYDIGQKFQVKNRFIPIILQKNGTTITYGVLDDAGEFCKIFYVGPSNTYSVYDNTGTVRGIIGLNNGKFNPVNLDNITKNYLYPNLSKLNLQPISPPPTIYVAPPAPAPGPAQAIQQCLRQYDIYNPTTNVINDLTNAVKNLHKRYSGDQTIYLHDLPTYNNTFKSFYGCDYYDKNYVTYYYDLYYTWISPNGKKIAGKSSWRNQGLGKYPPHLAPGAAPPPKPTPPPKAAPPPPATPFDIKFPNLDTTFYNIGIEDASLSVGLYIRLESLVKDNSILGTQNYSRHIPIVFSRKDGKLVFGIIGITNEWGSNDNTFFPISFKKFSEDRPNLTAGTTCAVICDSMYVYGQLYDVRQNTYTSEDMIKDYLNRMLNNIITTPITVGPEFSDVRDNRIHFDNLLKNEYLSFKWEPTLQYLQEIQPAILNLHSNPTTYNSQDNNTFTKYFYFSYDDSLYTNIYNTISSAFNEDTGMRLASQNNLTFNLPAPSAVGGIRRSKSRKNRSRRSKKTSKRTSKQRRKH